MHRHRSSGFTLVELSIVLVIIGLIVGGILVGRDLIRHAEVLSVGTSLQKYETAFNTYYGKYRELPGDSLHATTFFAGTANGNGDGIIILTEGFRAWQHLALAGLIEGSYTGVANGGADYAIIGENLPALKITNAGCTVLRIAVGSPYFNPLPYDNILYCGYDTPTAYTYAAFLTGREMATLDAKFDDGKPGSGRMESPASVGSCVTSNDPVVAVYKVDTTTLACPIIYRLKM